MRFFLASGCVFLSGDHIFQKKTPTNVRVQRPVAGRMAVTVPVGMQGGMEQTPSGMMQVTIPNGLKAGQGFHMMVPEAAPQLVLHL